MNDSDILWGINTVLLFILGIYLKRDLNILKKDVTNILKSKEDVE
jgi:hypothetical protein